MGSIDTERAESNAKTCGERQTIQADRFTAVHRILTTPGNQQEETRPHRRQGGVEESGSAYTILFGNTSNADERQQIFHARASDEVSSMENDRTCFILYQATSTIDQGRHVRIWYDGQ